MIINWVAKQKHIKIADIERIVNPRLPVSIL